MTATFQEISSWLINGAYNWGKIKGRKITHMLVVCDTFDYDDYPVYVSDKESAREVFHDYNSRSMQRVMEVYSYKHDLEDQLNEHRAFHFD